MSPQVPCMHAKLLGISTKTGKHFTMITLLKWYMHECMCYESMSCSTKGVLWCTGLCTVMCGRSQSSLSSHIHEIHWFTKFTHSRDSLVHYFTSSHIHKYLKLLWLNP